MRPLNYPCSEALTTSAVTKSGHQALRLPSGKRRSSRTSCPRKSSHSRSPSFRSARKRSARLRRAYTNCRRSSATSAPWSRSRAACSVCSSSPPHPRMSHAQHSDNIESNISSIAVDTAGAAEELSTAHEYQRKAGRRALCLMLILVVVVAVVLLAVRILLEVARCSSGIPMLC